MVPDLNSPAIQWLVASDVNADDLVGRANSKGVQRPEFSPGEVEAIELIVGQLELDLALAANIGTQRAEWSEQAKN
jgi:hypothetical protein